MNTYITVLIIYCILFVAQMIACQLAHSSILLFDSYVIFYKIIDLGLKIITVRCEWAQPNHNSDKSLLEKNDSKQNNGDKLSTSQTDKKNGQEKNNDAKNTNRLLLGFLHLKNKDHTDHHKDHRRSTFGLVRIKIVGSFVNSLFLSALALSVVTESIQNYLHASHETPGDSSYFMDYTSHWYPLILIFFAITGILVQMLSMLLGEFETITPSQSTKDLIVSYNSKIIETANISSVPNTLDQDQECQLCVKNLKIRGEFEEFSETQLVSLKSIKRGSSEFDVTNPTELNTSVMNSNSSNNSISPSLIEDSVSNQKKKTTNAQSREAPDILCDFIRDFSTPIMVIVCALTVLIFDSKNVSEISDVFLSAGSVCIMWAALWPTIKRSSFNLLQCVPPHINVDQLKHQLMYECPFVEDVHELYIWSLTSTLTVATCHVSILVSPQSSATIVKAQIKEIESIFQRAGITDVTIQPEFVNPVNQLKTKNNDTSRQIIADSVTKISVERVCRFRCCQKQILENHRPVMQLHSH